MSTVETKRVLVWDLPTRLFHWMLAASFFAAYVLSEGERWQVLHAMLGYTALGLIAFRVVWGLAGTRYARFTGFTWSPRAVAEYLRSLLTRSPAHYVGHNPAGSWSVLALLVMVSATALSGWAVFNKVGPEWLEEAHEIVANATIALVALHVAAVIISSALHRENLIGAMVTGSKRVVAAAAAAGPRRWVGALLVAAVIAFWVGWIPAPGIDRATGLAALSPSSGAATAHHEGGHQHRARN
jgi:cytochrome b